MIEQFPMTLYKTYSLKEEAEDVAEELWKQGRKALVLEVRRMPNPPRTADPWAVYVDD